MSRSRVVNSEKMALGISLLLHLLVMIGCTQILKGAVRQNESIPVMVDFTLPEAPIIYKTHKRYESTDSGKHDRRRNPGQTAQKPAPSSVAVAAVRAAAESAKVSGKGHPATGVQHQDGRIADIPARKFGMGSGMPGRQSEGSAVKNAALQSSIYLKREFTHIRSRIASNLRYPSMARRMGWSGRVDVEFIVRTNGSVDSIRVVRSSGCHLLDNDARETVIKSAPFPVPPVVARVVIPVDYALDQD